MVIDLSKVTVVVVKIEEKIIKIHPQIEVGMRAWVAKL